MRGGKARSKAGFYFHVQKWPMLESNGGFLAKKPFLNPMTVRCQGGRKSSGNASAISTDSKNKGGDGDGIPDVLQSTTLSTSYSFIMQVGTLPQFLDQWRSITSSRFVLNMIKVHRLQLRYHCQLFYDFQMF